MGRVAGLLVLLHYDLLTLKIGSEGGLTANWKTNQYNSTKGLVHTKQYSPLPLPKSLIPHCKEYKHHGLILGEKKKYQPNTEVCAL